MKQRCLALLLCLCLSLSGCGIVLFPSDSEPASTTTIPETTPPLTPPPASRADAWQAEQDAALDALGNADFENRTFIIATTNPARYVGASDSTQVISVAAYERANLLRSRYNLHVLTKTYASDTELFAAANRAELMDLHLADLFAIPISSVGTYAAHGILASVRDLPYVNIQQPYFHSSVTEATTIGNISYALATYGEFTPSEYPAVFFSASVCSYLNLDPYAHLQNNSWTWDTLLDMASTATAAGYTGFSLAAAEQLHLSLPDLIGRTVGTHPTTTAHGITPTLDYGNTAIAERVFTLTERVSDLFRPSGDIAAPDLFAAGGILFYVAPLGTLTEYTTLAEGYGILPMPKSSAMQSGYSTMLPDNTPVLVLPRTASDLDSIGRFVNYFAASSYGRFQIAETNNWLRNHLRDEQALFAIDSILASAIRADLSDAFGTILTDVPTPDSSYLQLASCLTAGSNGLLTEIWRGQTSAANASTKLEEASTRLAELLRSVFHFAF